MQAVDRVEGRAEFFGRSRADVMMSTLRSTRSAASRGSRS
jgi:hypothetical protein